LRPAIESATFSGAPQTLDAGHEFVDVDCPSATQCTAVAA